MSRFVRRRSSIARAPAVPPSASRGAARPPAAVPSRARQPFDHFMRGDDVLGETAPWLTDQLELTGVFFNGNAVGVGLPTFVEAEMDLVGGGSKGDTASGKNLKDAVLTNGETIKVPLFIESGEKVLVDTRTWEFARRAPKACTPRPSCVFGLGSRVRARYHAACVTASLRPCSGSPRLC